MPKVPIRRVGAKVKETKVGTIETTTLTTNLTGISIITEMIEAGLIFPLKINKLLLGTVEVVARVVDMLQKIRRRFDASDENVKEIRVT